jgi:hypothetical protein
MEAMIPMMDMAAATGMKLEGASVLVGRAISGEESALKRYGIALETGAGPQAVMTELMAKFAGQAEAGADPLTQLKNRMGDLMQVLGDALLPVMETLVPKIEEAVSKVIEWTEAHPTLTKVLGLAAVAIGAVLLVVGPLLIILPSLAAGFTLVMASIFPITATILAISVAIAATIIIWKKWEEMGTKVKIVLFLLFPAIVGLIALIKNWDKVVTTVKDNIRKFVVNIIEMGKNFLETIQSMLKFVPGMDKIKKAIDSGIGKLEDMEGSMHRWADSGGAAMGSMDDESGFLAEAIETNAGKMQTSFKQTGDVVKEQTEKVNASLIGIGETSTDTAHAFIEDSDEITTAVQTMTAGLQANADQIGTALHDMEEDFGTTAEGIIDNLQKVTTANELNAAIDNFLSNQRQENMEEEFETHRRTTDKILEDIDRGNAETIKRRADRDKKLAEMAKEAAKEAAKAKEAAGVEAEERKAQAAIAQFRQTPQFASMQSQRKALSGAEATLASAVEREGSQRERLATIRANAPSGPGSRTKGHPEDQRRRDYWEFNTRPHMNILRDLGDARRMAEERVEILRSNIAANRIPEHLVSAFQGGGISSGGLALVGERGPEIVSLPGGARVHPSGTGPGGVVNQFHFHGAVYGVEELKQVVVEAVRDHAISGGFSGVFAEA